MDNKLRNLLYRSFDEELKPEEKQRLENALKNSSEIQNEKKRILAVRKTIANSSIKSFKPFFAERIIHQLQEQEQAQESLWDVLLFAFRPVAIGAIILLIGLMSYNIIKSEKISITSAFAEPELTLEQVLDPTLPLTVE